MLNSPLKSACIEKVSQQALKNFEDFTKQCETHRQILTALFQFCASLGIKNIRFSHNICIATLYIDQNAVLQIVDVATKLM